MRAKPRAKLLAIISSIVLAVISTGYNTNQKTRFAMADTIKANIAVLKRKDCGPWPVQRSII